MQIPAQFKEKITNQFDNKGTKWLDNLSGVLKQCIAKWQLSNCRLVDDLSYNLVVLASSDQYGEVVLKIGVPHFHLYTEMEAINLFNSSYICQCYDLDKELGAMLLEQIRPGENLTSLNDLDQQLAVAADLIAKLTEPIPDQHSLPSYKDWLDKAFACARKEGKVGNKMLAVIDRAEELFAEIKNKTDSQLLLHGDLHHWNILKDEQTGWKAIDPKGVVGPACMESARFIDNQIDMVDEKEKFTHFEKMTAVFADEFNQTQEMIADCYFVLRVLSTCWLAEVEVPVSDKLKQGIAKAESALEYTKKLK
jgi:streptomycin 6-kinase